MTSSTKSGLPSARSTMAATSWGRSGVASVAAMDEALHDVGRQRAEHHPNRGLRCEPPLLAPADDDQGPGPARCGEPDPGEERGRGAVGPVGLLDDDGYGTGHQAPEQVDDDVRRPVTAVLRVDAVGLRRVRYLHLGDVRQEWRHRQEVGRRALQGGQESPAHDVRCGTRDAQHRAEGVTQHPVGARRTVGLTPKDQPVGARCRRCLIEGLVGQPRLSHPGGPVDGDHTAAAAQGLLQGSTDRSGLRVAPEEGQAGVVDSLTRAGLLTDRVDGQRLGLALHRKGPGRSDSEPRTRVLEHVGVRVDRASRSGGHDAGRGVGRVAHRGVGRALRDTDLGREDVATVDPQLERKGEVGIGDAA